MASNLPRKAEKYYIEHSKHKIWQRVVSGLACAVVFCTTYALILPAITMEQQIFCTLEEHQHGPDCYEMRLVCEIPEGHLHTDACYTEKKTLICSMEESENLDGATGHEHEENCYETKRVLTCGIEENHVHTDACYAQTQICEIPEHVHGLACSSNPMADVEMQEDWEQTLAEIELTGNWANDVIALAGSQLGYTESAKNYLVLEDTQTIKGYTRYGAWYGDAYADWSAMFASFCLNYAHIPTDLMPQEADCQQWVEKLSGQEAGYEKYDLYWGLEEGSPAPGDLVFFDWDGDANADHVGFVESLLYQDGTEITADAGKTEIPADGAELVALRVIEGDSDNQVRRMIYQTQEQRVKSGETGKSMEDVMGFATLPENATHDVVPDETIQNVSSNETAQEYVWQSEDGAVCLTVSFDGLAEVHETEEAALVLWPELNREDDVENLLSDEGKTDIRPLLTLRLHLMRGEEEIDLSGCTANVSLTATREWVQGPEAVSNGDVDGESLSKTLSVIDKDGHALASEELGQENVTLRFIMPAEEPVAVGVTSNPNFTIQHYLRYEKVKLARDSALTGAPQLEFIDTSVHGVFESAVTMQVRDGLVLNNSTIVQGNQGVGLNPNNGTLPDTFKVNLVRQADGNYRFEVETVLEALFTDEQTTYRRNPQIPYMNRLYNGQDSYNEYYTLDEVWVYQPPEEGTPKDTASLTDSDFIKYELPPLPGDPYRHDPEKIRFTNNPSNTHISQLDANGTPIATEATEEYPYVYTVLIHEGTVVRLVFNGTQDLDYTTENVQFFDYDITDGAIYKTEADARGQTNSKPTSQQDDTLWYAYTNQQGINSAANYLGTGSKLAFGNANTGTGLDGLTWNGFPFNMRNTNSYVGSTFGLAKGLTYGANGYPKPVFSDGIIAPDLFSSGEAEGKTAYLDDYKLNFHRIGGTYILNSVIKKGDGEINNDQTVLAGLRDFKQAGVKWGTTIPILTNEFWPLDGCDSHGTDGHDLKFGKETIRDNRKFVGAKTDSLPPADINANEALKMYADHNAYLGMTYHVKFDVAPGYCARMNYWFYGDDDMWVFLEKLDQQGNPIQTKLIADVGGVHSSVGEYVNLWEYVDENPLYFTNADGTIQTDENGNPVENQEMDHYRMTVFYTERGASGSSCYMRFNLPAITNLTPAPEHDDVLMFEKRLLGMDGNEVSHDNPENQEFTFLLTLTNASGTSYEDVYDYGIYNRETTPDHTAEDAQPLRSGTIGSADPQSGKYLFTLKGGEYIVISNLPDNTYYTIEETVSQDQDYVTYFQKGTHKHVGEQLVDTLGGLERYSAVTGDGIAQRYNGSDYNYIRFTNALPYKTEPDPGPEMPVQIGQEITYEIDWRKAVEKDFTEPDLVTVSIRDPLDKAVDFVSAKFGPHDNGLSWWDNDHPYSKELPEGVTASIDYDAQGHEVIWKLTYPKGTDEIPGVVALKVRVSNRVDFTQQENPDVVNHAFVTVGQNPEIETNWIKNPLEKSKTTNLKVLKNDSSNHRPLAGASFVLYQKEGTVNHYYSGYRETAFLATWAPLEDGQDESVYAWHSDTDGLLTGPGEAGTQTKFSYLGNGTYYLKELKAPDGYQLLAGEITFTVKDGTITVQDKPNWLSGPETSSDGSILYTLTVPNSTGYELPETGGSGTIWYKAGGLLMMTVAFGMYIGSRNRRRRERRIE